jgi:hypothetical protein
VTLVRTDDSDEFSASFIRVTKICELETTTLTSNLLDTAGVVPNSPILVTLMKEALSSSETSVLEPHGVASKKTPFFIVTSVKTSNFTEIFCD